MELECYLTKICYVSLGTKTNGTKKLRDTPKEEQKHPKPMRKEKEQNNMKTAPPRRPRAHGPPRPSAQGPPREPV
mgnify:CR=1 FL=1